MWSILYIVGYIMISFTGGKIDHNGIGISPDQCAVFLTSNLKVNRACLSLFFCFRDLFARAMVSIFSGTVIG